MQNPIIPCPVPPFHAGENKGGLQLLQIRRTNTFYQISEGHLVHVFFGKCGEQKKELVVRVLTKRFIGNSVTSPLLTEIHESNGLESEI